MGSTSSPSIREDHLIDDNKPLPVQAIEENCETLSDTNINYKDTHVFVYQEGKNIGNIDDVVHLHPTSPFALRLEGEMDEKSLALFCLYDPELKRKSEYMFTFATSTKTFELNLPGLSSYGKEIHYRFSLNMLKYNTLGKLSEGEMIVTDEQERKATMIEKCINFLVKVWTFITQFVQTILTAF